MKELDELQKALDNLDIIMMNTTDFGSAVQEAMNVVLNKWSVFRQSQEGTFFAKERSLRKLWDERPNWLKTPRTIEIREWTRKMDAVLAEPKKEKQQ